eukprot:CAMPEP_0184648462 /NCGR_PEP_ID=MMETSP0308-20130426/5586_1 /TAXON_ID=38269 /ORGANISM="Gloeochaete witrockiana, Strain SAG 46.84" /LENGTH=186 /DNA_ID=CAMNT_0027080299 /DNA_START=141 /DNA_END=701 /DNA_ORIENTATION=+
MNALLSPNEERDGFCDVVAQPGCSTPVSGCFSPRPLKCLEDSAFLRLTRRAATAPAKRTHASSASTAALLQNVAVILDRLAKYEAKRSSPFGKREEDSDEEVESLLKRGRFNSECLVDTFLTDFIISNDTHSSSNKETSSTDVAMLLLESKATDVIVGTSSRSAGNKRPGISKRRRRSAVPTRRFL